jgi:homoserine O-acetyltransferase
VAPWLQGTTAQLARQIGPGKLVDTSSYFVIMVDAFGNGVSTSPSTSARQPQNDFPIFTIRDIVSSQYALVTKVFNLTHLHAVVGISMGGMQAFEWSVTYPEFVDKVVSIVGSPQSQPDDHQRLSDGIQWVMQPPGTRIRSALSRWKPRTALEEWRMEPYNYERQARAIIDLDISRRFGGSMERTAGAIKADVLVVSTWADRDVNPKPAFELARLARKQVLELDGRCGHQAPSCERDTLWPAMARFLAE